MADGRDVKCWDDHALECQEKGRKPFEMSNGLGYAHWLRETILKLENVHKCLDIGCGPCYWVNLFEGFDYTGFDQSPGMIRVAQEQLKENGLLSRVSELKLGNARRLQDSFSPETFDLVFTSAVLQHNRHEPDKREIVEGMRTILKPGGYYLCTENTFRGDNAPQWANDHGDADGNSFTAEGWKIWMSTRGFEMLEYNGKSEYLYRRH